MRVTDEMVAAAIRVWHDRFDAVGLTNLIAMRETVEAALAAAPQAEPGQEPVAWMYTGIKQDGTEHGPHLVWKPEYMDAMSASKGAKAMPLYTAPPQRKPLTEEEIADAANSVRWSQQYHVDFARAIERAHGIGDSDE